MFGTDVDIMKWMPGKIAKKLTLTLPEGIASGKYGIEIALFNENIP